MLVGTGTKLRLILGFLLNVIFKSQFFSNLLDPDLYTKYGSGYRRALNTIQNGFGFETLIYEVVLG